MKIRLVVALAGLAISLALPTFAQQANTPDPQLRQVADALSKKFDDAWNNNDASALAALFTKDAVLVNNTGPIYGRDAIEKMYTDLFKQVHFSNHLGKVDQYSPRIIGNERWDTGEWSATIQVQGQKGEPIQLKGYFGCIDIRDGDDWKIRMLTYNTTSAPTPPAQTK
jgi:uncharacterized protein (TIGR02246 family)